MHIIFSLPYEFQVPRTPTASVKFRVDGTRAFQEYVVAQAILVTTMDK